MALPTLRQLEYLAALAEHRHFGRAAIACNVSQPGLSLQIRALERSLGASLVAPGRAARLTPLGAAIAARGAEVMRLVRELAAEAKADGPLAGAFGLGVIPTLGPYLLARLAARLRERHPRLRLAVREAQTAALLGELGSFRLDIAVLALPADAPSLATTPLAWDPFLLVVPRSHPLALRSRVGMADLGRVPMILLEEGHCLRAEAVEACRLAGGRENGDFSATSLAMLLGLVAEGHGGTLLPRTCLAELRGTAELRAIPFGPDGPGRVLGLAWRVGSPGETAAATMSGHVGEVLVAIGASPLRGAPRIRAPAGPGC